MANEELGKYDCKVCDQVASVYQSKRGKGRFLYKRCGCGCDQRNGAAVQTDLWLNTVWNEGAHPVRPPNVAESIGSEITEKEPVQNRSGTGAEPEKEPKAEPVQNRCRTEKEPSKKAPLAVLGVFVLGALALIK